jgi:hypothetical protein
MTARTRLLLVLWAAGAVSIACNVLSAEPTIVGRLVAAWPPVALLLVVEVLARSPLPTGWLRWVAAGGAASVALVAAIASFHHMHSVALGVGESALVAWLFPLSVDGLAVVASVALVGVHRPESESGHPPAPTTAPLPPQPEPHAPTPSPASVPASVPFLPSPSRAPRSPVLSNGSGSTNNHTSN